MSKSKVLVILTGSIAAYKACQVLSRLTQQGCEVQTIATKSALEFIGQATLEGLTGRKVLTDLYEPGEMMGHIHWARWADLILVAPCTANFINKISQGIADDLASTLFLAHDFKKPFLISPAMNTAMYFHPITQKSIQTLKNLGVTVLESASGVLACGEQGYGKLLEPDLILQEVLELLPKHDNTIEVRKSSRTQVNSNLRILITAGGTVEKIDDVRAITNKSSGKTGFELAKILSTFGLPVTLLLSENSTYSDMPTDINIIKFSDFKSLCSSLESELKEKFYSHVFHLAAVSDYSVESIEVNGVTKLNHKIPSGQKINIQLKPNPKIVNEIKKYSKNTKLISFKLTSKADQQERYEAVKKLMEPSQSDYVVHNDLSEINSEKHIFTIYKNGSIQTWPAINAIGLADFFIQEIL